MASFTLPTQKVKLGTTPYKAPAGMPGTGGGIGGITPSSLLKGFTGLPSGIQTATGAGGTGTGTGTAPAPAAGTGGDATNYSANNPDIAYAAAALKSRYEGDNGAGRAIDLAMGKLRDSAEGERRAAAGRREARGVSGTGVDSYDEANIENNTQRQQAGAASDIASQAEQAKTGLLGQIVGAGNAQGSLGIAERGLALQQSKQQQDAAFEAANAQRAQETAILDMLFRSAA